VVKGLTVLQLCIAGSEIQTVNFMKFSDWKSYVEMNVEHFSTLHPSKGSLIWMAGSNVSDPPVVDVFWRIWKELDYTLPDDITKCYIFEMLNPERTNIVEHEKVDIILTGVRDLETLQEEEAETFAQVCAAGLLCIIARWWPADLKCYFYRSTTGNVFLPSTCLAGLR
jgi:hypothetical protein